MQDAPRSYCPSVSSLWSRKWERGSLAWEGPMGCRVQSWATAWRGARCWPRGCWWSVLSVGHPHSHWVMSTLRTQWAPLHCPALSFHTLGELGGDRRDGTCPFNIHHLIPASHRHVPYSSPLPLPLWLQIGPRPGRLLGPSSGALAGPGLQWLRAPTSCSMSPLAGCDMQPPLGNSLQQLLP